MHLLSCFIVIFISCQLDFYSWYIYHYPRAPISFSVFVFSLGGGSHKGGHSIIEFNVICRRYIFNCTMLGSTRFCFMIFCAYTLYNDDERVFSIFSAKITRYRR